MNVRISPVEKTSIKCEKCGENYFNAILSFHQRFSPLIKMPDGIYRPDPTGTGWKARRGRGFYTPNAYLCYDCMMEAMNNLAKHFLELSKSFAFRKVTPVPSLEELAAMKHIRQVRMKKNFDIKQTKQKESHTGIDVIGHVL